MVAVPAQAFFNDPRRAWLPGAVGVVIAGAGIWLIAATTYQDVGIAVMGWGLLLAGWSARKLWRRPLLWFDAGGLRAQWPGVGQVPWRHIESVRLERRLHVAALVVDRNDLARRLQPSRSWARTLARLVGARDLAIPVHGLSASPEQILAVVELAWRHVQATRSALHAARPDRAPAEPT
jgi:hypothetical protein